MNPTRRTNIVATSLPDIRDGKAPAPYCEAAPPRACSFCGVLAVLPLDAEARLAQPDATTHVCHPILGGCNQGFTVYATEEPTEGGVPCSLRDRAARLAERTADAYSADAYTSWRACAMLLLKRGYSEREAEAILRSKVTRWAGDASNKRYGQITARDLAAYLDKHVTPAFVAELVAGTFGGVS